MMSSHDIYIYIYLIHSVIQKYDYQAPLTGNWKHWPSSFLKHFFISL